MTRASSTDRLSDRETAIETVLRAILAEWHRTDGNPFEQPAVLSAKVVDALLALPVAVDDAMVERGRQVINALDVVYLDQAAEGTPHAEEVIARAVLWAALNPREEQQG